MRRTALILLMTASAVPAEARSAQLEPPDSLEARVWLDRGEEPVVNRGDEVRVYYRTSADAYVAIFRIDTDGVISLIFPQHPDAAALVRGGRDYRLLFPRSPRWRVEEDPGVGYFFIVASPEPLDFSLLGWEDEYGWDLGEIGATVYEDPYVAIDDYVAAIVPDWEFVPYALDFLSYSVGERHEYPRFLCYDCHGYQNYRRWNPYNRICTSYRVVIWDDPYFYPRYRYVGTRVVFARPFGPRPRYEVINRVRGGGWAPIVRVREAPPRRVVEYKESPRRPAARARNPVPRGAAAGATSRGSTARTLPNRAGPSRVLPPRTGAASSPRAARPSTSTRRSPPRADGVAPRTRGSTATDRPTLQRRPPSARLPERRRGDPAASSRPPTRPESVTRGAPRRPGSAAPTRRPPPSGVTRAPSRSRPGATPARPPARAIPRAGGARPSRSPAARPPRSGSRPTAGSRPPPSRGPTARPSTGGRPTRGATPPRRRPGGRGGSDAAG